MRRTRYIVFLCIINLVAINFCTGSNFPINPNGVWKVYIGGDWSNTSELIKYYIDGDTLINSNLFYKIYKSGVVQYDEQFIYNHIYVGAMRDENNKIFCIRGGETLEKIWFDFNLKLGDTIKTGIGKNYIINNIDTLGDGRKLFGSIPEICAGCCPIPILIEGIGHAGGLFELPPCNHPGFIYNELTCYSENGNIIYSSPAPDVDCDAFTDMPTIPDIRKISISPVPANNMLSIEFHDYFNTPSKLSIYNISGSLILSEIVPTDCDHIDLNLEDFSKGIYFICLINDSYSLNKKIIIE